MAHLPEQAEKVFDGVIFDVYQWEQELYDGTTATFEMLRRNDGAEVIAIKDDKIMIQIQEQPLKPEFVCLPSGNIEDGEDARTGAARELLEETGYVSDDWDHYSARNPYSKYDWTMNVFIARSCQYQQEPELDGGEKIQLEWVTFDELLELVDSGKMDRIEQELRAQLIRAKYHKPSYEEIKKRIFG